MKQLLLVTLFFPFILISKGQTDSLMNEKLKSISIGTPLFPGFYFDVHRSGSTQMGIWGFMDKENLFPVVNFCYKTPAKKANRYRRFGTIINKVPKYYSGTNYYAVYYGRERKLNENKRFDICIANDISFGFLEFYNKTISHTSPGLASTGQSISYTHFMVREFLYSADWGISMRYHFTKRWFIESETLLMFYIGAGKSVNDSRQTIGVESKYDANLTFSRFLGLNVGCQI